MVLPTNNSGHAMKLAYDIRKTYLENYQSGPDLPKPTASSLVREQKDFFGTKIDSRLGIAAGLLLNSKWLLAYADLGYDLLTYKTVRSAYRPCYPPPNWVFIESDADHPETRVTALEQLPTDPLQTSSSVCFGMPSMDPDTWRQDIVQIRNRLPSGKALIVSVVGTPNSETAPERQIETLAKDFAQCAEWAVDAGAQVVEANFSCPNVCTKEGSIYMDPNLSRTIAEQIKARIPKVPLLIKAGNFPDSSTLGDFLKATDDFVDGIALLNGMSREVRHRDGRPVYGVDKLTAGILGRMVHKTAIAKVRQAVQTIEEFDLSLKILAVGGVSCPNDIQDFLDAGADAIMLGSAPMYIPHLAEEAKQALPDL
ncbi:MAG TPA: hypothetical protein EYQ50_08280 [Verrucomicrobiales bacterium]|nr:hypothetical protein [Verrucomicrobiales bacterium]HIL69950.1 hypothetical protein [Verrucomicrobiota bacterium]